MKFLTPKMHGYLDYLVVAAFLLAPAFLGITGLPRTLAYAIAAVHLVVTLLTAFPLGAVKLIPFTVHGALEAVVALGLVALPWLAGFAAVPAARGFYVGAGIVILLVVAVTDYKAASAPAVARG